MNIKIKKIHKNAMMPTYGTDGAAAFDLYAADTVRVWPRESRSINTGLAFEIPTGYVMRVYSRSGHGFKHGVRLVNSVGVIDSDYRGVLMVGLSNEGDFAFDVKQGDRIAQAIIEPIQRISFEFCDELSETERGSGGFGSTGL
jgi:dUTP pyrophosphatase